MKTLTPRLRDKLLRFHEAYQAALDRLLGTGPGGEVPDDEEWEESVAAQAWEEALQASPLSAEELRVYKMHVAIYIATGKKLFSAGDKEVSE